MTVQPTSLAAYNDTVEPRLRQEERIWRYMIHSGEAWCISDLALQMGLRTSSTAARLNHLKSTGWLEEVDRRPSRSTGIVSLHYRAVVPDGQERDV